MPMRPIGALCGIMGSVTTFPRTGVGLPGELEQLLLEVIVIVLSEVIIRFMRGSNKQKAVSSASL